MDIRKVGVVGLGTMGAGIAQVSVQSGFETVGREVTPELGERGRATIERYLSRGVEKGRMSNGDRNAALGRLTLTTGLSDLADCDLVIEAVLEELELKREVFAELDRVTRPEAVLATNTSALSVAELAAATVRPERVVGMHFFNPAPVLPLVEVVRTSQSSDDAVDAAFAWAERAGKQPVRCNDTPGFIVNRILIPLLNDCVRVLDEAGVPPEDVDKAMTNGAGWPLGPCALIDLIGIDVHVHASEALHGKLGEPRMAPPDRLVRMQQDGKLGRKSGGVLPVLGSEPLRQRDLDLRQLRMPRVRFTPDLLGPLRLDHLERDRAHRRHGGELDEAFRFGMAKLSGCESQCIEARHEQARRPFATGLVDHCRIFAPAPDAPPGTRLVSR